AAVVEHLHPVRLGEAPEGAEDVAVAGLDLVPEGAAEGLTARVPPPQPPEGGREGQAGRAVPARVGPGDAGDVCGHARLLRRARVNETTRPRDVRGLHLGGMGFAPIRLELSRRRGTPLLMGGRKKVFLSVLSVIPGCLVAEDVAGTAAEIIE